MSNKYWTGNPPERCQICKGLLTEAFIDGVTRSGRWVYMCRLCHSLNGYGLGIGKGQLFVKVQENWIKQDA